MVFQESFQNALILNRKNIFQLENFLKKTREDNVVINASQNVFIDTHQAITADNVLKKNVTNTTK